MLLFGYLRMQAARSQGSRFRPLERLTRLRQHRRGLGHLDRRPEKALEALACPLRCGCCWMSPVDLVRGNEEGGIRYSRRKG